jgi:hypothetical protein
LASAPVTDMEYVAGDVLLVVDTVSVEVPELVPLIVITDGLKAQVGGWVPPVMLLQESVMLPVYPLAGVTVIVEVADPPTVTALGLSTVAVIE